MGRASSSDLQTKDPNVAACCAAAATVAALLLHNAAKASPAALYLRLALGHPAAALTLAPLSTHVDALPAVPGSC